MEIAAAVACCDEYKYSEFDELYPMIILSSKLV